MATLRTDPKLPYRQSTVLNTKNHKFYLSLQVQNCRTKQWVNLKLIETILMNLCNKQYTQMMKINKHRRWYRQLEAERSHTLISIIALDKNCQILAQLIIVPSLFLK